MEIRISGRVSHAYTPFRCWFICLTTIVRNIFFLSLRCASRDCCIWFGRYGYQKLFVNILYFTGV